jgi:two-component system phosphate regulon sensor histidine kinase PhoR
METLVIILTTLVLALVAYVLWSWHSALREITRGLHAMGDGLKARLILSAVPGPIGNLIKAFNIAAAEVQLRQQRLDEDRQQLRVVLEAMDEAVIAVDTRQRLSFANASAQRLFALEESSAGRLVPELIRSPQVQQAVEATLRLAGTEAYQGELNLPGWDIAGRSPSRVLLARGTRLPGRPAPGVVLVFHDVTELRRLERMRQDFVANASHELKTPLASIKAYNETLLDWALHDETVNTRFLERIDEQVERLNQLILDLLSLARIESGQEPFEHNPLSVVPVLESCVESHQGRAEAKGLSLEFYCTGLDETAQVRADEEAIRQIVDNLVDNAIKYTPEGKSVAVSCWGDNDEICIEVADTGIGIPRDDLPRIFERFYRVDKARSRELGGTGLGLSIVKHLVSSIGGQIDVTSRVGSGSRFTVHLPRSPVALPVAQLSGYSG